MLSPSGSALPPGGTITQEMRITSTAKVNCFEPSQKRNIIYSQCYSLGHPPDAPADIVPVRRQPRAGADRAFRVPRGPHDTARMRPELERGEYYG